MNSGCGAATAPPTRLLTGEWEYKLAQMEHGKLSRESFMAIKKLWDYIKEQGLQDAANKRAINADAKLLPVFGKPQVTMFELAGIVGRHLS